MKKTITMLFALCGIAAAETVDLLASPGDWNRYQTTISDGTLQGSGQWKGGYATYTLDTPITLNYNMTLELSYTMTFINKSDVAGTVALHSSSDVLAFGAKTYNGGDNDAPFCIGYSEDESAINANAITFGEGYGYRLSSYQETPVTAGIAGKIDNTTASHSIKEIITWRDEVQKYVATIYVDKVYAGEQTLGSSYTLEKISVASSGNHEQWRSQPSFSDMQIKLVPEPTTATLSLLALCGLAARRRRK